MEKTKKQLFEDKVRKIVSGALWVTSKTLQNFASVSWEDIGKGIVTLGGLVGAGILLGQMSGSMIKGAIAIGLLGARLDEILTMMQE